MMSYTNSAILLVVCCMTLMMGRCDAFSPTRVLSPSTTTATELKMGLFDMFQSPEEKEKNRLRKEREVEEQERLLAEMRERRTNPEKMEEYEIDVVRRRQYMKNEKREWEKFEDKVGEGGVRVVSKKDE
jgi:hypothetical protein